MKPRRFIRMFKKRFVPMVARGAKPHTVRPRPKRMPQPGDIIEFRFWAGKPYRSKQVIFGEAEITTVWDIRIEARRCPECPDICIDDDWLNVPEMEAFAKADGFESAKELGRWFHVEHSLPFEGIVIYWAANRVTIDWKAVPLGKEGGDGCD